MTHAARIVTVALSLAAFAALTVARPAGAEVGRHFPGERLEPATDKEGIGNTEWAGIPDTMGWDAALWLGYESNPLFNFTSENAAGPFDRKNVLVDNRFTSDVVLALALYNWIQIGLDVPVLLFQSRNDATAPVADVDAGALVSTGLGDIAISPKLRVLRQSDGALFDLAALMPFTVPTGQFTDYFGQTSVTLTPTLAISHDFGSVRAAANVGHRFRSREEILGLSVGNELVVRGGVAYDFEVLAEHPTELGLSLSSFAATDNFFRGGREQLGAEIAAPARNPVELLLDVRHNVVGDIDVFFGGGAGVIAGYGVPDYRMFAGVRISDRPPADYDGDGLVAPADKCPRDPENVNGWLDEDGCPDAGDDDKDGIDNNLDKCPQVPEDKDGVEDLDGCPEDDDKDGVLDDLDKCRTEPEDKDGFEDGDGCPELDNDKDGIPDETDKCVNDPEDKDGFEDEDGCPELDNDKDGFPDESDLCPNEAGVKQNKGCPDKDRDGDTVVDRLDNCPDEPGPPENGGCAKKQLVVITDAKLEIKDRVYFKTDKDVIEAKSFPLLDNIAAVLKAHPEIQKVRVEGHTDTVGNPEHNKDLSNRRAKSVKRYLVEKAGIEDARLDAIGYGQDRPIASNDTDDGKQQNRRVEFVIVDHEGGGGGASAPEPTPTPETAPTSP